MAVYAHEPERALLLIDSAERVGNLADFRADMLRAQVYGRSMQALRLDSAQLLCEALLSHDSVRADADLRVKVLDELINVCRLKQAGEQWLRWATAKADLCHELAATRPTEAERDKAETEALRTEAEIGVIQTCLGQRTEGLARLDYIIACLDRPGSVNRFDALMIALKRKVNVLQEQNRQADIIPVARQMLDRLDHFVRHATDYAEDSDRLPACHADSCQGATDRASYIDFYRAKAHIYLAEAYAALGDRLQAREHLVSFEQSDFSTTYSGRAQAATVWLAVGEEARAQASFDAQERHMQADTLCADYAVILRGRAEIAERQGRLAASLGYRRRYEAIVDSLHARLMESKAADYAARYQLQEHRLETERLKARTAQGRIINIAIGIALVLALAALLWYGWQQRVISRKNRSLVQQISEAIKYKRMYEEATEAQEGAAPLSSPSTETIEAPSGASGVAPSGTTPSEAHLFDHIHTVIKRERLYLDPAFDRQAIIDYFHLSKERIGQAFAQGSDYTSLPGFIRNCRLEHACELLTTHPEMSINDVMTASGFSNLSVFSRNFKQKYDLTPSAYRREQQRK